MFKNNTSINIRKIIILTTWLFLFLTSLFTQSKFDYQWVFSDPDKDAMILNFNNGKLSIEKEIANMYIHGPTISICDETGELIFYSNACEIRGRDHKILQNGEQLNPGEIHDEYCPDFYISGHQSLVCLPHPGKKDAYYMFHERLGWTPHPNSTIRVTDLFYTQIEKENGSNKWIVTRKNQSLISNPELAPRALAAIKHHNGNDWWLMSTVYERPEFMRFWIKEDSIYGPFFQTINDTFNARQQSGACFSPDGKKYAHYNQEDGLSVFDFDRNTGLLSNKKTVKLTGKYFYGGLAISPNSRFAYVCAFEKLYQFDLTSNELEKSKTLIATFDGIASPNPPFFNYFVFAQLGPDCRIYIGALNGSNDIHVIMEPDLPGKDCNFVQHGLKLPNLHGGAMPFFPLYRMDEATICDSTILSPQITWTKSNILKPVKIFPNPVIDQIELNFDPKGQKDIQFNLITQDGIIIFSKTLNATLTNHTFDFKSIHPGFYYYQIRCTTSVLQRGKIIKQ